MFVQVRKASGPVKPQVAVPVPARVLPQVHVEQEQEQVTILSSTHISLSKAFV